MTGSSFRKLLFGTFALFPKESENHFKLALKLFFSNFAASINPLNHTSCTRLQRVNKIFEWILSQICLASSACRWGKTHLSFRAHYCIGVRMLGNFGEISRDQRWACGLMKKTPPLVPRLAVQFPSESLCVCFQVIGEAAEFY